jgi:hypothetical protein
MVWPGYQEAGKRELTIKLPAPINEILLEICKGIQVGFREAAFRL